jgi:hypothetical protein
VYINGKPLEEPYVRYLFPDDLPSGVGLSGTDPRRKFGPVTVPPDMFFMMGDNRDNSEDSRFWGFMPRSYIKGKALFVYFSFGDANGLSGTSRTSAGAACFTRFTEATARSPMKTLIKLIIAAVVVNAAYRGGSAYLKYYQFKDETQQMILFGQAEPSGRPDQDRSSAKRRSGTSRSTKTT